MTYLTFSSSISFSLLISSVSEFKAASLQTRCFNESDGNLFGKIISYAFSSRSVI